MKLIAEDRSLTRECLTKEQLYTEAVSADDADSIRSTYDEWNRMERELREVLQKEKSIESRLDEFLIQ